MIKLGITLIVSLIIFVGYDQLVRAKSTNSITILPMNKIVDTAVPKLLDVGQKMDTIHFWKIMDYAFEKAGFDKKLKEETILNQLTRLTPEQIVDFEIIFQQMNLKANTWNNLAAQTLIDIGTGDDGSYYFRCWLISLGQNNFDKTLESPDHLASLPIPKKENGFYDVWFEELIPMADIAYGIVTNKNEADSTFPRSIALQKGLFYDSGGEIKGKEWRTNDELKKIAPLLYKKYRH